MTKKPSTPPATPSPSSAPPPAPASSTAGAGAPPRTLSQWREHIAALTPAELVEAAGAANGIGFVEVLEAEGYAPPQIHAVLHAFAARFVVFGLRPPGGGLYDLAALGGRPAPVAEDEPGAPPA